MRKKEIHILALCMALCLLCGVVSGCGAKGQPTKEAKDPVPQRPASQAPAAEKPDLEEIPTEGKTKVEITMADGGSILLELDSAAAPVAVANFLSLVEQGFYDGLIFHRIDPAFMIQGGDPKGTGTGGPGYQIKGEFKNNGWDNPISHKRGVISMARSRDYDSAGSQFFIVVKDSTFLDGDYAAFGQVLEGMDVVDAIANAPRSGETPVEPAVMESIRVVE